MQGLQVEIESGFAYIEFLDKTKRGDVLQALIAVAGPEMIEVNTGGTRKTYIVPESIAEQAGILAPAGDPEPKKAPARKRAAAKPKAE